MHLLSALEDVHLVSALVTLGFWSHVHGWCAHCVSATRRQTGWSRGNAMNMVWILAFGNLLGNCQG